MEEIDSATASTEPAPSDEADSTHDSISANGKTYRKDSHESCQQLNMLCNGNVCNASEHNKVVGLGNPGMDATRHSVGMAVLGALAARLELAHCWHVDKQVSGEVIVTTIQDMPVILLRPKLLMNINGVSVARAAVKYGVRAEDILLVHDELDKALGKTAFKNGGSASGHNGVRSCVDTLQSNVNHQNPTCFLNRIKT
ncbi:unnamed protein product [Boreogadus saida]